MIKRQLSAETALERLEAQCATSEYCTQEIMEKLYRWGVAVSRREEIVKRLVDTRFVDNARFARAYVRDKSTYGKWGRRKIAMGLASKRIDRETASEALTEIDEERYYDNLCAILKSRLRTLKPDTDYDVKMKLYRRGLQCGYEPDIVGRAVKEIMAEYS